MKITGSYDIDADQQTVWDALNDTDVLKACIPGCDSLERTADNELTAAVTAKVGPVKAKFSGVVELKDLNPPTSYRIEGSGKGGAAGFAKGGADVSLADNGNGGTTLTYEADAQVGGKLAQIGGRLIDGTAKKMADQFFDAFREQVSSQGAADQTDPAADDGAEAAPEADAPAAAAPEVAAEKEPAAADDSAAATAAPESPSTETPQSGSGLPAWVWFIGAVALIIVLVALAA